MAEDNTFESDNKKVSQYNEAFNQILRLDKLWSSCNDLSVSGKLILWKWKLDAIWRELSPDAWRLDESIKDKSKGWIAMKQELNNKISEARNNNELFYAALSEKEEFLRRLMAKAGKGARLIDEDDEEAE